MTRSATFLTPDATGVGILEVSWYEVMTALITLYEPKYKGQPQRKREIEDPSRA